MLGGEGLSPIDTNDYTNDDEQRISKEVLAIIEALSDLPYLPHLSESMRALEEGLGGNGIIKESKTVGVNVAGTHRVHTHRHIHTHFLFSLSSLSPLCLSIYLRVLPCCSWTDHDARIGSGQT